VGSVLAVTLGSSVRDRLAGLPQLPAAAVEGIATAVEKSGGQALASRRNDPSATEVMSAVDGAFVDALRTTTLVGTGALALGLLLSISLPNPRAGMRRSAVQDTGAAPAPAGAGPQG
jgi:hypothetical protein